MVFIPKNTKPISTAINEQQSVNMHKLFKTFVLTFITLMSTLSMAQEQTPVSYFGAIPDLKVLGKEFVDPTGKAVTLHGVMDTPNAYFNGGRWAPNKEHWVVDYSDQWLNPCKEYFKKVFQAIANPAKGSYCNLFRLHLDPAWTNDPNKTATNGGNENDISRFSADLLRKHMEDLYVPIAEDALAHGLYVIMRPPGVFPEDVTVGDAYNEYLLTVWDIVSSNDYVKSHAGQIMLELGNEPVRMSGHLADYFQPIVNKIRDNGFKGILLLPGTSYQADYRSYNTKPIEDNNFGYAVHNYPGWYGGWDANQTEANFISTFEAQVPVDKKPIVITEVDWSPMKEGAGHWNEMHTQYTEGNFGTWGTGTTNSPAPNVPYKNTQNVGWGMRFKNLMDKHPNISWTLQGTTTFVDMDAYLLDGTVKPAFTDAMEEAGYADAKEACSGSCFDWYKEYACGNRIPYGTPSVAPEVVTYHTTATTVGNAYFDETNAHYCFYTPTYSSFVFDKWSGTRLDECAELIINLGEGSTIGYRLDVQLKDENGNIIKDGTNDFIIGTEGKGTRFTTPESKTYVLYEIFSDYLQQYPNCTIDNIRLNTVVSTEDTDRTRKYWFTLDKMELVKGKMSVEKPVAGTDLADIPMYRHVGNISYIINNPTNLGGWGNGAITNNNDGSYKIVISEAKNSWEGQFNIPAAYAEETNYTLTLDIKGTVARNIGAAFQKSQGYEGRGNFPAIPVTTSWNTVSVDCTVTGPDCDRLLLNYGDYLGTLEIKNIKVSTGSETTTEITGQNIRLGEEATNGAEVFGAGLMGNVTWNEYADLSAYKKMVIKGSGGSLRVMYNRPETGACPELNPSLSSGEATIDLSSYPYFHLNSIKSGWEQTVNVTSIRLYEDDNTTESVADYIITGAGYQNPAVQAALADESATVIDVTGITNQTPWHVKSANPNCLIVYKNDDQVDFSWTNIDRNLVKNSNGSYSSFRTDLVDGYDFRAPFDFVTVGGASYQREQRNAWATMALPFELDVEAVGSPEIFVIESIDKDEMTFTRVTEGKISAGKNIMMRNKAEGDSKLSKLSGKDIIQTPEGYNIQPIEGISGWYTAQTFKSRVIENVTTDPDLKNYDVYYISNDMFYRATGKLTLGAFRSIFLHQKAANQAPARLGIRVSDEETEGIEKVSTDYDATECERYDAAGRRIYAPTSGLNIIRMSDGTVKRTYIAK